MVQFRVIFTPAGAARGINVIEARGYTSEPPDGSLVFPDTYLGSESAMWGYTVGATFTKGPLTAGLSYVDTDTTLYGLGRHISKGGVVASLGVAF